MSGNNAYSLRNSDAIAHSIGGGNFVALPYDSKYKN